MKTRDCDTFCCSSVCSANWALCLVKLGVSNSSFRLYSSCTDTMILEETPISLVPLMFWLDFLFKLPQLKASSHKNSRFISIQYFTLDNCWTPFSTPYWNTGSLGLTSFPPISVWGSLGRQIEVKGKADPHGQWKSRKPVPSDCCKWCFASHVLPEAVLALCAQPPDIKHSKTQQWMVGDRGPSELQSFHHLPDVDWVFSLAEAHIRRSFLGNTTMSCVMGVSEGKVALFAPWSRKILGLLLPD